MKSSLESDKKNTPWFLLGGLVLAGLALRLAAARGGMWLDEVWSLLLIQYETSGPGDLFFSLRHDNNHILNSLYLYAMGPRQSPMTYRLLSIACGTACVALAGWLGNGQGKTQGLLAAFFTALSFPLVTYSSEARGYAPAMLFSLLAYAAGQSWLKKPRPAVIALFWLSCVLGALSHLSFGLVYAAVLVWTTAAALARPQKEIEVRSLAIFHGIPALFWLFLLMVFVWPMQRGGGPESGPWDAAVAALSWSLGLAPGVWTGLAGLFVFCTVLVLGLATEKSGAPKNQRIFFLCALLLLPALSLALSGSGPVYFRYLVVVLPFYYLLAARVLCRQWKHRAAQKAAVLIAVAVFMLANAGHLFPFFQHGRGNYLQALTEMARQNTEDYMVVASSDQAAGAKILMYYSQFLPPGTQVVFVSGNEARKDPPGWFIQAHPLLSLAPPPPAEAKKQIAGPGGKSYELFKKHPASGLSGTIWEIYRRVD